MELRLFGGILSLHLQTPNPQHISDLTSSNSIGNLQV